MTIRQQSAAATPRERARRRRLSDDITDEVLEEKLYGDAGTKRASVAIASRIGRGWRR
jgi:hypothetical protein